MARPSRNQDKLLIETAKRLLPSLGVENMSLKLISDESGVNLGMIHYYFKTKSLLMRKVLESIHEELLEDLTQKKIEGKTALDKLRCALIIIAKGIYKRRKLILSLVRDLIGRDKESTKFFFELTGKRMQVIIPLIKQCQKEGSIESIPFYQLISFLMASINMPTLIGDGIKRVPTKKMDLPMFNVSQLLSEKAIIQRVDMALKAISTRKGRSI